MRNLFQITLFVLTSFLFTSCEAIGDIFGAGVYTGIFLVVIVIVIIVFLVMKMGKKN